MAAGAPIDSDGPQATFDFHPGRVRAVELHRSAAPDLDRPETPKALKPKELAGDFGKLTLLNGRGPSCGRAGPWEWRPSTRRPKRPLGGSSILEGPAGISASFSILRVGIRQLAGGRSACGWDGR